MTLELSKLPYSHDALEPFISRRTLELHHGKHHGAYVEKLNKAIEGSDYARMSLENIIVKSRENSDDGVFNNAAQIWNHTFLWDSMSPDGGGDPEGDLKSAIASSFGDLDEFRSRFKKAALGQFGSGWTWLVRDGDKLSIKSTSDAGTPIADGESPILTLDVWEHAYYLDYQNERDRYVDAFLEKLINWEFAAMNFEAARKAA